MHVKYSSNMAASIEQQCKWYYCTPDYTRTRNTDVSTHNEYTGIRSGQV